MLEAPFRPLSTPEPASNQAGASLRARAYPLDLPFDSPEATSTMHLTDDCRSLYPITSTRTSLVLAFGERLPSLVQQGIQWFTPLPPLRRIDQRRVGHYPPSRRSDTTEPLTPLSPARSLLPGFRLEGALTADLDRDTPGPS